MARADDDDMTLILKRFGIRITRGYTIFVLLVGAIIAAAFWIGPLRPVPAQLELFALTHGGRPLTELRLDTTTAVPSRTPGSKVRFPLVLAVRNTGATPARPTQLDLTMPARFRLLDGEGEPVQGTHLAGNPLVRYRVPVKAGTISPGGEPVPIAYGDTLWVEPALPDYYCTFITEGVPEFEPAPVFDPASIATIGIFYSFVAPSPARQTGVLTLRVEPSLLNVEPPPTPPTFKTTRGDPEAPRPVAGDLTQSGERTEQCGDPDQALALHSVLWETAQGGRVFVIHYQGTPRKEIYDLNRDGIVEYEAWDADADGRFEASRPARYRIPSFLMPVPPPGSLDEVDPFRPGPDWLRNFYDIAAGPFRFLRTARDTADDAEVEATPPAVPAPPVTRPDTTRRTLPPAQVPDEPRPDERARPETRIDPPGSAGAAGANPESRPQVAPGAGADAERREPIRIFGMPITRPPDGVPPDTIRR